MEGEFTWQESYELNPWGAGLLEAVVVFLIFKLAPEHEDCKGERGNERNACMRVGFGAAGCGWRELFGGSPPPDHPRWLRAPPTCSEYECSSSNCTASWSQPFPQRPEVLRMDGGGVCARVARVGAPRRSHAAPACLQVLFMLNCGYMGSFQ